MYGLCFKERVLIFSREWGVSMHLKDGKTCFKAISLILILYFDIFSLNGAFVLWYKRKNAYFSRELGVSMHLKEERACFKANSLI